MNETMNDWQWVGQYHFNKILLMIDKANASDRKTVSRSITDLSRDEIQIIIDRLEVLGYRVNLYIQRDMGVFVCYDLHVFLD